MGFIERKHGLRERWLLSGDSELHPRVRCVKIMYFVVEEWIKTCRPLRADGDMLNAGQFDRNCGAWTCFHCDDALQKLSPWLS